MNRSWCNICCFCVLFNIYFCSLCAQENAENSNRVNVTLSRESQEKSEEATTNGTASSNILRRISPNRRNNKANQRLTPQTRDAVTEIQPNSTGLRMITPCTTPNDDSGFCMPVKNCSKLLNELANEAAGDFLRNSLCSTRNVDPSNPYVCCGQFGNYKHLEDPFPKSCGRQIPIIRGRILGGKEAKLGEFPWMARLFHRHPNTHAKTFGCGGSLIAARYVLTAGHCLESENVPLLGPIFEVQFGEHNTETKIDCNAKNTKCAEKPQVIRVKKNIVHPHYRASSINHHHDIGLIHLKKAVRFSDYVYPICLLKKADFHPIEFWISGWGTTKDVAMSSVKIKLSLPLFSHSNCTDRYSEINVVITDKQICAGGKKNKDSCTGDSGGPLMVHNATSHWFAAGVVSYGRGCGMSGWPGVYTNVTSYYHWIESTILSRAKLQ